MRGIIMKCAVCTALLAFTSAVFSQEPVRVSLNSAGIQANGNCDDVAISDDGRFIAFSSTATNLDPRTASLSPTDEIGRLYLHDVAQGTTTLVSVSSRGEAESGFAPRLRGDLLFFISDSSHLVSESSYSSYYVYHFLTGQLQGVDVSPPSDPLNHLHASRSRSFQISQDGWIVLMDMYIHNRASNNVSPITVNGQAVQGISAQVSRNGEYVAFLSEDSSLVPNDMNNVIDAFVYSISTGAIDRVSMGDDGLELDTRTSSCAISDDGRFVAFTNSSLLLAPGSGGYIFDRMTRKLRSTGSGVASFPISTGGRGTRGSIPFLLISGDARFVAFEQNSPVSVYDSLTDTTHVVTYQGIDGQIHELSAASSPPDLAWTQDFRYLVFSSRGQYVLNDTNNSTDVFLLDTNGAYTSAPPGSSTSSATGTNAVPLVGICGSGVSGLLPIGLTMFLAFSGARRRVRLCLCT